MNILLAVAAFSLCVSISFGQAMLAILFFTALYAWLFKKSVPAPSQAPYFWYFLPVLAIKAISIPFGVNPAVSVEAFASEWIILYFFSAWMLARRGGLPAIFLTLAGGGTLMGLYGFTEVVFFGAHRAEAGFTHALTYGNIAAILMILCLAAALKGIGRTRRETALYWVGTISTALGLLASGSRGPILFGFVSILTVLALASPRRGLPAAVALGVLGIAALVFVPALRWRFGEIFAGQFDNPATSIGTRVVLWSTAIDLIKQHWATGIGPGNFREVMTPLVEHKGVLSIAHAHNAYLQAALLHGVFGLVAILVFLGKIGYDLAKKAFSGNAYAFAGFGVLIIYLLEGLTENNFTDSEVSMLFYFITGAVLGASWSSNAKTAGE